VIAGIFAGVICLFAQMGWAVENLDKPAVAPMLDMSTVFNNVDVPAATAANVVIGLVTHLTLTMLFGIAFALIVPLLRTNLLVLVGGLVFGVLLYVFNIQILGRLIFEWFTNPAGPSLPSSCETLKSTYLLSRRARLGACWDVAGEAERDGRSIAGASRRRAEGIDRAAGRGARPRARRAREPAPVYRGVQARGGA